MSPKLDEWGNILNQTETVANPFKYTGEIYDSETGLYYLRARYYDPKIGRFTSKDAYEGDIANPLSLNPYTYAYNNPLSYIDPSGNIGIRQWDNLGMGLAASVGGAIADLFSSPMAIAELYSTLKTGKLPLMDLAKAIGASAIKPISYPMGHSENVWLGKPTDAEVYTYGKHLGNVLLMVVGSGGKALSIVSKVSPRLAKLVRATENVKAVGRIGIGFNTFKDAKKFLGSPGKNKQWHHIVEQSQMSRSGFSPTQIHNTNNLIAIDSKIHAKLAGIILQNVVLQEIKLFEIGWPGKAMRSNSN